MAVTAAGAGKGGGLLEKPTIERTTPGRESEFDLRYSHYTLYSIYTNCQNYGSITKFTGVNLLLGQSII